jgi:hypothetical protein
VEKELFAQMRKFRWAFWHREFKDWMWKGLISDVNRWSRVSYMIDWWIDVFILRAYRGSRNYPSEVQKIASGISLVVIQAQMLCYIPCIHLMRMFLMNSWQLKLSSLSSFNSLNSSLSSSSVSFYPRFDMIFLNYLIDILLPVGLNIEFMASISSSYV